MTFQRSFVIASIAAWLAASPVHATTNYFQDFETNDSSMFGGARVANGGGVLGVSSYSGSYHYESDVTTTTFTRFGGYSSSWPADGYTTSLRLYLDTTQYANTGEYHAVGFSSANNDYLGNHPGTDGLGFGDWHLILGQSDSLWTAHFGNGSGSDPFNTGKLGYTQLPSGVNGVTGWYELVHKFRPDASNQFLEVEMQVNDPSGNNLMTAVNTTAIDLSLLGGNRYGWFVQSTFSNPDNKSVTPFPNTTFAIDDVRLEVSSAVVPVPGAGLAGLGLIGLIVAKRRRSRAAGVDFGV